MTLVNKKVQGRIRLCIDYRKLNQITIPDRDKNQEYMTVLDHLANANNFSSSFDVHLQQISNYTISELENPPIEQVQELSNIERARKIAFQGSELRDQRNKNHFDKKHQVSNLKS